MPVKIPVILGGYVNGYSLARGFYESANIKSIIIDYHDRIAKYSKFISFRQSLSPSDPQFINYLESLGKEIATAGQRGVIITTNDEWMIPVSIAKDRLSVLFDVSVSNWEIIKKLTIKENFYSVCDELKITYPRTIIQRALDFSLVTQLHPPLLCKPSEVVDFTKNNPGTKRNAVFNTHSELVEYIKLIRTRGFHSPFIVQEYISGGAENLYTVTTCSDSTGKVRGLSIGRKLTQYPPSAGTITSGLVEWQETLVEPTVRLLDHVCLVGMANTEYKRDPQTGTFSIIETNPRPGMWNYSTLLSGVNLYHMILNDPPIESPIVYGKDPVIWSLIPNSKILNALNDPALRSHLMSLLKKGKKCDPRKSPSEGLLYKAALFTEMLTTVIKGAIWRHIKKNVA